MDAYRKARGYDEKEYVELPKWLVKFAEEAVFESSMDDFRNSPTQFISSPKPPDSTKQIALLAAVEYQKKDDPPMDVILRTASTFHQWLTEPQTDKR